MTTLEQLFANVTQDEEPTPAPPSRLGPQKSLEQSEGESISKSERIRRYLAEHPETRNRDVVTALSEYGVSAADVGNVKSQMKRKEGASQKSRRKTGDSPKTGRVSNGISGSGKAAASPAVAKQEKQEELQGVNNDLGLDIIEAGVDFIRRAGGINEAQYVLNLIRQIRSMS